MKGFFSSSATHKEKPNVGLIPKCGLCGLFKGCKSPKMRVQGDGEKRVLIVGEAPGEVEDEHGLLFIGKAGQFLRDTLDVFEIDLDKDAWTTNALICRHPDNATPTDKQIDYCRPNILNAIKKLRPKVVVTLGRAALASVLTPHWYDIGQMERWTGWRIPLPEFWLCPTYQPSHLMRMNNPLMNKQFLAHLKKAFNIKREIRQQEDYEKLIEVHFDETVICNIIQDMASKGGWVAFDYEGNCLKPEYEGARIYSASLSNGRRTIAYPWTKRTAQVTGLFLKDNRTMKIASNLKFEERWTKFTFGHGVSNWGWDTMLAAHCLDNRRGITSLKFQTLVKFGFAYNNHIEPYLKSEGRHLNRIGDIDLKQLLFYNGMDSLLEFRLAMIQRKEMGYNE